MKNIFYTYIYLDPRKPGLYKYGDYTFDYEPFYVGKGNGNRINAHIIESKDSRNYDYKHRKIRKILEEGLEPIRTKLNENLLEHEAFELEINLIREIGRFDLKFGPLTNHTDGGDGTSGTIVSKETRKKISKVMKGKQHSEETRKKISDSHKGQIPWNTGKHHTEESKRKMSEAQRGGNNAMFGKEGWNKGKTNIYSEETRQKMSESHKGKNIGHAPWNKGKTNIYSEETKKKMSESHKRKTI